MDFCQTELWKAIWKARMWLFRSCPVVVWAMHGPILCSWSSQCTSFSSSFGTLVQYRLISLVFRNELSSASKSPHLSPAVLKSLPSLTLPNSVKCQSREGHCRSLMPAPRCRCRKPLASFKPPGSGPVSLVDSFCLFFLT